MTTLQIGITTKGSRIWLQGLERYTWPAGTQYTVQWDGDRIILERDPTSKRKVTAGKGGIIDLTSKKVERWAEGATTVEVCYDYADTGVIAIQRGNV